MKFSKEQIRKVMLLYAVTDRAWLKEGETLCDVCKSVRENGTTFLRSEKRIWTRRTLPGKSPNCGMCAMRTACICSQRQRGNCAGMRGRTACMWARATSAP